MNVRVREATDNDLGELLELYTHLNNNVMPTTNERAEDVWTKIRKDANHHVIVAEYDGRIVSSCILLIVPNLTHNQEPYALIENVVTHTDHRNRGFASAVLESARDIAVGEGCYKISLMTGSKRDSTLRFYENAGYNRNDKTAFIRWFSTPPKSD